MITVSIDIGGTRLKSALIAEGKIIESAVYPIEASSPAEECLALLEKEVNRLASIHMPSALGIAFPGIVNPYSSTVVSVNGKYEPFVNFAFDKWAEEKFQLPMRLENDANAALLGELHYGCGQGYDNAVLMILGTGIGSAAMIEGKLIRGKHFQAGCLGGHISVNTLSKGRPCTCGSAGCAESVGGGWALDLAARQSALFSESGLSGESSIDYQALAKWEQAGDILAYHLMEESIDAWSTCAVNLIHAYDPDIIVLSGGVLHLGERITAPIADNIARHAWTPWGSVELLTAKVPEHSVVLGLHSLCLQSLYLQ